MNRLYDTLLKRKARSDAPAISLKQESGPVPLSFAQERLWFLEQLAPGTPNYNVPVALRLKGRLQVQSLGKCINNIVLRHEALRTTFDHSDGRAIQLIAPTLNLPLLEVDLRAIADFERESELQRLVLKEARKPFDLKQGPLIRAALLRLAEEEHVLLLTMHHIVSDGWSISLFLRELAVFYEASSAGKAFQLPSLYVQYADFARWQRERMQGDDLTKQLEYWKRQLAGELPVLDLPTDRARPPVPTYRGARHSWEIGSELSGGLKNLSRQHGVTLFMLLLAGFQVLLQRYSGQEDVVVGTPVAGRNLGEVEGLIGFFVNTLVMRTDLSGDPSFREALRRVKEVALGAYAHQDVPFEKLVEELRPERNMSRNPLFQVMFGLQNVPGIDLKLSGLQVKPMEVDNGTAKFDLTLLIREEAEGLKGVWEYSTDLFNRETIERMGRHFEILLKGALNDPDERISRLPVLPGIERQLLLVEWNQTASDYPKDKHVHQMFEAQVEQAPDAVAVIFEDQQISYLELNRRANRLAHYLRRNGVDSGKLVAVCLPRSPEMVVAILAVLKAGAAYIPLDPSYPADRLSFMIQDSGATLVLLRIEVLSPMDCGAPQLCLDQAESEIVAESNSNPKSTVSPQDPAYVIYTSGSTGKPKGVLVTHSNLLHSNWARFLYYREPVSAYLLLSSFSFDSSVAGIFWTLCQGGRLVLPSEEQLKDILALGSCIKGQGITHLLTFPSFYDLLLAESNPGELDSLRAVIVAGEPCPDALLSRHKGRLPRTSFFNEYGPTESTVWCSVFGHSPEEPICPVNIGRPIANTRIHILNSSLQLQPIGVPGEIYVGGGGVARGYLNRPELTAERFLPDAFLEKSEARLYKTGDLGRWLPDGGIAFLGRLDQQVKIRGFRIELGEIESCLDAHPDVGQSAVMTREDRAGEGRLVGYLVAKGKAEPNFNELRTFLKTKLPEYMIPTSFCLLEVFPRTPNGKLDRRALPEPEGLQSDRSKSYVAPRGPVEEVIARIWAEVLRVETVSIHDNFFDLGGHSLLAVQVISRIRKRFHVELPLRTLFENPTVEHFGLIVLGRMIDMIGDGDLGELLDGL